MIEGEDMARSDTGGAGQVPDWRARRDIRPVHIVGACAYVCAVFAIAAIIGGLV